MDKASASKMAGFCEDKTWSKPFSSLNMKLQRIKMKWKNTRSFSLPLLAFNPAAEAVVLAKPAWYISLVESLQSEEWCK